MIGLTIVSGVFTLILHIPIDLLSSIIDGYAHPVLATVLAFIASIFIVNNLSNGVYLAALHAVVKPILIVGGIILVLGLITALAGPGDDDRRDG